MKNTLETNQPSRNRSLIMFILRNILGLILIIKGILYVKDTTELSILIQETGIGYFSKNSETLALVISILSILGGTFLIIGLFTRLSAAIQIPILVVATFFVNIKNIDRGVGELVLSIFVLVLLILFVVKGAGKASGDNYFFSLMGKQKLKNPEMTEINKNN